MPSRAVRVEFLESPRVQITLLKFYYSSPKLHIHCKFTIGIWHLNRCDTLPGIPIAISNNTKYYLVNNAGIRGIPTVWKFHMELFAFSIHFRPHWLNRPNRLQRLLSS